MFGGKEQVPDAPDILRKRLQIPTVCFPLRKKLSLDETDQTGNSLFKQSYSQAPQYFRNSI